jgi:hypothetical protein
LYGASICVSSHKAHGLPSISGQSFFNINLAIRSRLKIFEKDFCVMQIATPLCRAVTTCNALLLLLIKFNGGCVVSYRNVMALFQGYDKFKNLLIDPACCGMNIFLAQQLQAIGQGDLVDRNWNCFWRNKNE